MLCAVCDNILIINEVLGEIDLHCNMVRIKKKDSEFKYLVLSSEFLSNCTLSASHAKPMTFRHPCLFCKPTPLYSVKLFSTPLFHSSFLQISWTSAIN